MVKRLIFIQVILVFAFSSFSQIVNRKPLSERITGYRIDAKLDPETKIVSGAMEAFWVNKSSGNVADLQLHMYLNAFRSNRTTFHKETRSSSVSKRLDVGWIDLTYVKDRKGNDLEQGTGYISPDDGNPDDMTVLRIILPEPVRPGDTAFLDIGFLSKLPKITHRTGFNDDFFFVAQWFPKFGVYETAGMRYAVKDGWNCHQFHSNSEFYSNHSTYDVNITLPEKFVVGTGGMQTGEKKDGAGNKTLSFRAEDIVDFAWTAWPGYSVNRDKWKHVDITFLSPPERKEQVARQLQSVKNALEYLEERVGPFPWPHLTFVDPPSKGSGAGGMEYTTIFTSASANGVPEFLHFPEMVTIHEFGHAYFMGILASNEFEEPWLDEGVNSFWESRIMDHYYGENSGMVDHPLLKVSDKSIMRLGYLASGSMTVVSNNEYSWNYPHGTYGMMSYQKTATWLYTLMGIVGEETTDEIFREYYRRWAFRHPSGKDFVNVANEVTVKRHGDKFGPDLNWFFDQTLYGTGLADYKVKLISNTKISSFTGISEGADSMTFISSDEKKDSLYRSVVELERPGNVMLPVDVLIHFDNNDSIMESWDGKATYKDFSFTGKRKIDWVKIDPGYKLRMDINFTNNSYTTSPDNIPVRSFTNKIITLMEFFINFISL